MAVAGDDRELIQGPLQWNHGIRVLAVVPGLESGERGHWRRTQMESLRAKGIHVSYLVVEGRDSFPALIRFAFQLRRDVRAHDVDLIHVHWGSTLGLTAALTSPTPVVISFCGSDLLGAYNLMGRRTWRGRLSAWLSQFGALRAQRTIAKSRALRDALWPKSRGLCEVIPNGVDLGHFHPIPQGDARASLGWKRNRQVVLFFNREGAWVKNPDLAFSAFRFLRERFPNVHLEVVENQPHEKMPDILNASDVLLMTSLHEGSSNLLKEALACNLPVITTNCGDAVERLADVSPSFVCGYDARELAGSLGTVLTLSVRSNGRSAVADSSLGGVAERILAVYRAALGQAEG